MPMVNGEKFPYTAAGRMAAKIKENKTGKKMVTKKTAKNKVAKKSARRGMFGSK